MSRFSEKFKVFANSKVASWLMLLAFFYAIAAASHAGFMAKYAMRDGYEFFSLISMIDETAQKPFVYRQLLPAIGRSVQKLVTDQDSTVFSLFKKFNLDASDSYTRAVDANVAGHEYAYRVVYLISFFSLLTSLFLLRTLLLQFGYGHFEAVLAPAAFVIAFPYIQSIGGFFYDSIELAFFAGALLLVTNGYFLTFIILTIIATFNKESFLFFIPSLYPFIRQKLSCQKSSLILIGAMLLSGFVHLFLIVHYKSSAGSEMYLQIYDNLSAYFNPLVYIRNETTYGLPGPSGFFITNILLILIIAMRGYLNVAAIWKKHFLIAAAINLPLFVAFCAAGELRNLSLLYVGTVIFMAGAIQTTYAQSEISK